MIQKRTIIRTINTRNFKAFDNCLLRGFFPTLRYNIDQSLAIHWLYIFEFASNN